MRRMMMRALPAGAIAMAAAMPSSAAVLFSDGFNSYAAGTTGTQAGTGLTVGAFGTLAGWTASGQNAVHAVDRTGAGDWAVMFYGGDTASQTNAITLDTLLAANESGAVYQVAFQGAAADYAYLGQGNGTGDLVKFEVLRSNGSVLRSYLYDPADWTNGASNPFMAGAFSYTGDGTGNVGLRISASAQSGHFGGAVDNLSVSSVPEPATWTMMIGGFGLVGGALRRRRVRVRFA